ncbi:MAG: hypothetical protein ABFQ95_01875 [Pseudomonadota bacterium]
MGFVFITAGIAAGTSEVIEEDILPERQQTADSQTKVFIKSQPGRYGVQALLMGPAPEKTVSGEMVKRYREVIYVHKGPGDINTVFERGFMIIEGPVLGSHRRKQVAVPKGGPARPVFLTGLLSGANTLVIDAPTPDPSGFGSVWDRFLCAFFDASEPDEDEIEMDEDEDEDFDIEAIEVNCLHDE